MSFIALSSCEKLNKDCEDGEPVLKPGTLGNAGNNQQCNYIGSGSRSEWTINNLPQFDGAEEEYTWTLPEGSTYFHEDPDHKETIRMTAGAKGGQVCVTKTNKCGTSNTICADMYVDASNVIYPLFLENFPGPTGGGGTAFQINDKFYYGLNVYNAGSVNGNAYIWYKFDPTTLKWTTLGSIDLLFADDTWKTTVVDGRVFAFTSRLNFYEYDIDSDTWNILDHPDFSEGNYPDLTQQKGSWGAFELAGVNGKLVLVPGNQSSVNSSGTLTFERYSYIYDLSSGTWTKSSELTPIQDPSGSFVKDGKIYVKQVPPCLICSTRGCSYGYDDGQTIYEYIPGLDIWNEINAGGFDAYFELSDGNSYVVSEDGVSQVSGANFTVGEPLLIDANVSYCGFHSIHTGCRTVYYSYQDRIYTFGGEDDWDLPTFKVFEVAYD